MVNSTATAAATANPTPQEINRFLIPLSFLERISLILKGIFSKESFSSLCAKEYEGIFSKDFKSLCGIKYRINPDYINNLGVRGVNALSVVNAKFFQIIKSDCIAYIENNFRNDVAIYRAKRNIIQLPNKTRSF